MSRLTRDETAEPVLRDQVLRRERLWSPFLFVFSWAGKIIFPLSPFAPENFVWRDGFGRPVPRKPAYSSHADWIWCLLTGFLVPRSVAASVNVSVQYNGGFLPDIIHYATDMWELTRLNPIKSFCLYSQHSYLNVLTIATPWLTVWMLRFRFVRIFLQRTKLQQ